MKQKLTLTIENNVISAIKNLAKEENTSISQLAEDYFKSLTKKEKNKSKKEIHPLVSSLIGIAKDTIPKNKSYKQIKYEYLREKYLGKK